MCIIFYVFIDVQINITLTFSEMLLKVARFITKFSACNLIEDCV